MEEERKNAGPELDRNAPDVLVKKQKKREILRNRIKFVGKMAVMMKTLREENEAVVKLTGLAPDKRIPYGLLSQGTEVMDSVISMFSSAKQADNVNEKMPDMNSQ
jgi:serine/threonine-protein phosphatase 2B catalytic subunit